MQDLISLGKKPLSKEEERQLLEKYKQIQKEHGAFEDSQPVQCEVRDKLIMHNLRLIVHVAKSFKNRAGTLEFDDLLSMGVFGLTEAIDRFRLSNDSALSTYAVYWIRQKIRRGIRETRDLIRKPVHLHEEVRELTKAKVSLKDELGREPTDAELLEHLGWTADAFERVKDARFARAFSGLPGRSDDSQDEMDEDRMSYMSDPDSSPESGVTFLDRIIALIFERAELTARERLILALRFGLGDSHSHTLMGVSREMADDLSRERVRQIQAEALEKIADSLEDSEVQSLLRLISSKHLDPH